MILITAGQVKKIILITGPPRNGHDLLEAGLNFLCRGDSEGAPLINRVTSEPERINNDLARAAGLLSDPAGILPPGWQKMEAMDRAKREIKNYLANVPEGSVPHILGGFPLCRFMPLWLKALGELGIEPNIIHLTRHPWEVARALLRDEALDLDNGHRLWFACHRDSITAGLKHQGLLVAYEQLLEEPCLVFQRIGEALDLSYGYDLANACPLQLVHAIQAHQREFYADSMTGREKELYSVFCRLYHGAVIDKNKDGRFQISRALRRRLKTWFRIDLFSALCARMDQFSNPAPENDQEGLLKTETFWGASINLIPRDQVSAEIYAFELVNPALSSFFVDYLKPGWTVIDVGAHLGYFSMLAAALVGAKGKVVSFEPSPLLFEFLNENLRAYPQAGVVPKLAWHKQERVNYKVFDMAHSVFNAVAAPGLGAEQQADSNFSFIRVQGVPLDAYCAKNDLKPDLVKIDVAGAEMQALEGMTGLLEKLRPVVTFEVGASGARGKRSTALSRDLIDFMQNYDYEALESVGYRLHLKMNYDHKAEYDNMILVPQEKLPLVGIK